MICFEVSVNGERVHTAGVQAGVLVTGVHPSGEVISRGRIRPENPNSKINLLWGGFRKLSVGDEVLIRIVSADHCDEPTKVEGADDD